MKVIFCIFYWKYLADMPSGCNFASLFGSQDVQDCVSDFFDAFSGRWHEIIEMFAMRKIDSAETRKGNPRVHVKIPTRQVNTQAQQIREPSPHGGEVGPGHGTEPPLRFHLNSCKRINDNTTTKSLILAQDER